MTQSFNGAKAATFIGDRLLVILRDDTPGIDYPDHWDFPGGGREPGETGLETLAREMDEEVGLPLEEAELLWSVLLPAPHRPDVRTWFFVVRFPEGAEEKVRFGDEGRLWELADVGDVMARPKLVPVLRDRLAMWLDRAGHRA